MQVYDVRRKYFLKHFDPSTSETLSWKTKSKLAA